MLTAEKISWSGDNLWCLLNLDKDMLEMVFPVKWDSISRKKRLYKNKITQGVIVSPERPEWYQEGMSFEEIAERLAHVARPLGETAIKQVIDDEERGKLHEELDKIIDRGNHDATEVDGFDIVSGAYEGQMKGEDGQPIVTTLHKRSVKIRYRKPGAGAEKAFPQEVDQVEPAIIYPTQEKAPVRAHKLILAFGDAQIAYRNYDGALHPIHDEQALAIVRMIAADLRPETIVNLGDTIDLPDLSRFPQDSNHFVGTMQQAFERVHRLYSELRADNPDAHIVEVDSNHNSRLGKYVIGQVMPFYGLRQAGHDRETYPVLTYPHLANFGALNIDWVSGYDAARFVYNPGPDSIVFRHGKQVRSNGSTAQMLSQKNPYNNLVVGHGHQAQMHSRTTPEGRYYTAVQAGAICKITGEVPSYHSAVDDKCRPVAQQEEWQQGVLVIEDYGDGRYNFLNIPINKGVAYYQGKEYNATHVNNEVLTDE